MTDVIPEVCEPKAAWDVKMDAGQNSTETLLRLRRIFGGQVYPKTKNSIAKWHLNGRAAIGAMMTLWTLMSSRRKDQIEFALNRWKSNQPANGVNQLKFVPRGENHCYAKLTEDDVKAIRSSNESLTVLGKRYSVNFSTIGKIKRNERWKVTKNVR